MSTCQENGHYCPNCDTSFPGEADLIRANAELTASNARMRGEIARAVEAYYQGESLTGALQKLVAETPAESLAAITGPLEAKHEEAITKLIDERDEAANAFDDLVASLNVETEYSNLRGYPEILSDCEASLAAMRELSHPLNELLEKP
jgi:DNA repair exonuclease SbcCD ATPase subunit